MISKGISSVAFRTAFLRNILILGAIAGPIVALYHWHSSVVEGCINIAFGAACLTLLLYLWRSRNLERAGTIALILSYANFTLGYVAASFDPSRVSVFFPLLAAALFLKGERAGLAWLSLIIATVVVLPEIHGLPLGHYAVDAIPASICLLALFFIVLSYERSRVQGAQNEVDAAILREGDERMRALYANQYGYLLVTSAAGIVQSASDSVAGVLGFTPTELVGTNTLDLVHPDDLAGVAAVFSAFAQPNGVPVKTDMRIRCKNGEYRVIEGNGVNLLEDRLIHGIVLNGHDVTDRKSMEEDLRRLAQTDELTGLNNRRHFFELAEQETSRSKRYGRSLGVLMIDIDHFKAINDTYGHHVGDMVLRELSEVATKAARGIDIIGRIGGEEFALVLPEAQADQAVMAAERLRVALAESVVYAPGAPPLRVTVSIGVTTLMPADATFDAILARADAALYAAKESGRNRVCTDEDVLRKKEVATAA